MSKQDTRAKNRWYEYRVEATVEYETNDSSVTQTAFYALESEWINNKEMAVNLAQSLRDAGHMVEIRTRKVGSYAAGDFDAIPDRGEAE